MNKFTACPNILLDDSRLDSASIHVWLKFAQYDGIKEWIHNVKFICKTTNLHKNTVLKKIKLLCKLGYLLRIKRTRGFGYDYSVPIAVGEQQIKFAHNNQVQSNYNIKSPHSVNTNNVTTEKHILLSKSNGVQPNIVTRGNVNNEGTLSDFVTTDNLDSKDNFNGVQPNNVTIENADSKGKAELSEDYDGDNSRVHTNLVITNIVSNNNIYMNKTKTNSSNSYLYSPSDEHKKSELEYKKRRGEDFFETSDQDLESDNQELNLANLENQDLESCDDISSLTKIKFNLSLPKLKSGDDPKLRSEKMSDLPAWFISPEVFDPKFIEYVANDYMQRYGHNAVRAKRNAQLCFVNNPDKIPVYWASYQESYIQRIQNAKTIIDSDGTVSEKTQSFITENARVIFGDSMNQPKRIEAGKGEAIIIESENDKGKGDDEKYLPIDQVKSILANALKKKRENK